jgi:hypothetical protein
MGYAVANDIKVRDDDEEEEGADVGQLAKSEEAPTTGNISEDLMAINNDF